MNIPTKQILTEVQSYGVKISDQVKGWTGGAGPAEGIMVVFDQTALNVPVQGPYVYSSPYSIVAEDSRFALKKGDEYLLGVDIVPDPAFYSFRTREGIPYKKIALLHGRDCLGSTVLQQCVFWNTDKQCKFCGIGLSLNKDGTVKKKTPEQLAEVAQAAETYDGISHVVLTTGSFDPPGQEIRYLAQCAKAIKSLTPLPVHVQFAPPEDMSLLKLLKKSGVETVGVHVESFDQEALERIAPAKAKIGMERYYYTWQKAVDIFGPNQVSSFLIAGLGESPETVVWGSEVLADLGVYPFVVPLRPIQGSIMSKSMPPCPQTMSQIYEAVARILQRKGLSSQNSKAGCVRCGACSALSAFEKIDDGLVCHQVREDKELAEIFRIRHKVFVDEQKLFQDTDRDEHDRDSIYLVLKTQGRIIGTVRIYPTGIGCWIGSRLAVLEQFRNYRNGRLLIKEAMKRVKKMGGSNFRAYIQESNIKFFRKVGWHPVGELLGFYGQPHQLMEADLDKIEKDFP